MVKLNVGAGNTQIEGWIPIDRKLGQEAYPLPETIEHEGQTITLSDGSVDEIRASHILEHFDFAQSRAVLQEWVRVLKPGGRIRIAVPDARKINWDDPKAPFFMMGGQTDGDDYHKSAWTSERLEVMMREAGLDNIQPWTSQNTDCASLPISLNLEGTKREDMTVRIGAYMTVPRYEATVCRGVIESALRHLKIELIQSNGVFWGQCMQRMFEEGIRNELDWILTIDSDSLFTSEQLSILLNEFANHPEADAMAALQCRRGKPFPLMTCGPNKEQEVQTDGSPILVTTAHFGLTLIRVEDLIQVPKPWFKGQPDENGEWGDNRLDDDIWFWHQWRLAGKTIYVSPKASIGHLEETVAIFDEELNPKHIYITEWREQFLNGH